MDGLVLRAASYPGDSWVPPAEAEESAQVAAMVPRQRGRHRRGPMFVAAVVCTLLCSLVPRPAYADPAGSIPDTGSRPIASGTLLMPGQGGTAAPAVGGSTTTLRGPLATQLASLEITVSTLGQKRLQAQINLETAQAAASDAQDKLRAATAQVAELRSRADSAAAEAYKRATGLGPLDGYAHDLHQFGLLAPGLGQQPGSQQDARDLLRAEQEETAAKQQYQLAQSAYLTAQGVFAPLDTQFKVQEAAFQKLKADNEQAVLLIAAQEAAAEQNRGTTVANVPIDGMVANPKAIQALNFALGKIGSWYVWGDEGPNTFDCSGLAYWSYGQVGVRVPRVANDMYHGTPAIQATKVSLGDRLLPGDLVFFASDSSDWRSIYHMGIYVGGGKMVHAPTTGETVKIGQVKWSRFFGATRIFPAVPAPGATPSATTTSPSASATATPSSSATASPSTSTSASPTGSASPSTSTSTSSSPSPSATSTSAPPPEPEPTPEQTTQAPPAPASSAAAPAESTAPPRSTGASTTAQTTASASSN